MKCRNCGAINTSSARVCKNCGEPLAVSAQAREAMRAQEVIEGQSSRRASAILAILLILVGIGGWQATGLLIHAMRPATAADIAARTCTALTTRNYDLISAQVDTTTLPDITVRVDPKQIASQLRAEDDAQGAVTSCTAQEIALAPARDDQAEFILLIARPKAAGRGSITLFLRKRGDDVWVIRRDSNFFPPAA